SSDPAPPPGSDPLPALDHGGAVSIDLTPGPSPARRGENYEERGDQSVRLPLSAPERGPGGEASPVTLSVIVVGYNRRDLLAGCIESVLAARGDLTLEL